MSSYEHHGPGGRTPMASGSAASAPRPGPLMRPPPDAATVGRWRAAADWYHAFFTGLILATVVRRGADVAEELVYRVFCHQREQRFLPGLRKLGLDGLPHAVAAAQYHYLSNNLGGVSVQYMPESDRKAWVRYTPPRWVWAGTALCAVPSAVSAAMLRGWHAQNGVSLGNPRLGFVCTKQTADGDASLEGYYLEYDRPLAPHERLRFARDEDGPDFDPALAPVLAEAAWPAARIEKARRNYAMEYVRTTLPIAVALLGPQDASALLRLTGKQVGMQHFHALAAALLAVDTAPPSDATSPSAAIAAPAPRPSAAPDLATQATRFAAFMATLAAAQDDTLAFRADGPRLQVTQTGWTLFDGVGPQPRAVLDGWNGLLEGALAAFDHRLSIELTAFAPGPPARIDWTIAPRVRAPASRV